MIVLIYSLVDNLTGRHDPNARPYLKPRDVFDLHWLAMHGAARECSADSMRVRLATYPNETPAAWLNKALSRRQELQTSVTNITHDLKRWLPPSWPLDDQRVKPMVDSSIAALEHGINQMRALGAEHRNEDEGPGL